ncbi:MAG: site-specific integrase [Devosia sp.]|nr:site-specific integrase [Devosia sp.]
MKPNPSNERVKHRYFQWLRNARQKNDKTIDQVAAALDRFEEFSRRRDFGSLRVEQAGPFKKHLASQNAARSGTRLSKATITSTLYAIRDFVRWLAEQKGFRNRILKTDADYFSPSLHDEAIARATRPTRVPTLGELQSMVAAMPTGTPIDRRDRAVVALIAMSAARDDAVASLQVQDFDVDDKQLFQDSRHVRTKFRKTFPTWLNDFDTGFFDIVAEWKKELVEDHGFGPTDPLFPKTDTSFGPDGIRMPPRLARGTWANADAIRRILSKACAGADVSAFKPHSIRKTMTLVVMESTNSIAAMKAYSQNLGHDDLKTTIFTYGNVPTHRQRELVLGLRIKTAEPEPAE